MLKRLLFLIFVFFFLISSIQAEDSLSCKLKMGSCLAGEDLLFQMHGEISSNVRVDSSGISDGNYPYSLCCSSKLTALNFSTEVGSTCQDNNHFMHFTDLTNARIGFSDHTAFNPSHYAYAFCPKTAKESMNLHITKTTNEVDLNN